MLFHRLTFGALLTFSGWSAAVLLPGLPSIAADWQQFRGPEASGYVAQGSIPNQWTADDYSWKVELPGAGVGSPVVFDGIVYLLNADADKQVREVLAFQADSGHLVWRKEFPLNPHHLHQRNTFASSTPYVDDSGVYVAWADPERVTLVALDHAGEERWQRDLGTWQSQHGFGASPVMLDEKLILFNSQQVEQLKPGERPGESRMMAFDPATGKTLWSTTMSPTRACYGVPVLRHDEDGRAQIIGANTGNGLFALDAETGKLQWSLPVFSARCVSCPIVVGDVVIGSAGSGGGGNHLVAVRPPSKKADATQPTEVYRMERNAPYVPTPAVVGTRLFMVDDRGIASCIDSQSGEVVWSKRVGGNFGASPIVVGDKLLVISLNGEATILLAADTFKELGQFELGAPVQATPAYANGTLFLRIGNTLAALPTRE